MTMPDVIQVRIGKAHDWRVVPIKPMNVEGLFYKPDQTAEYICASPEALRSHPVVKELLAKERERCAQVARSHLQRVQPHNPDAVGSDLVSQGYGNACLNILCDIEDLK